MCGFLFLEDPMARWPSALTPRLPFYRFPIGKRAAVHQTRWFRTNTDGGRKKTQQKSISNFCLLLDRHDSSTKKIVPDSRQLFLMSIVLFFLFSSRKKFCRTERGKKMMYTVSCRPNETDRPIGRLTGTLWSRLHNQLPADRHPSVCGWRYGREQ